MRFLRSVVLLTVVVATLSIATPPATAAVSCHGSTCTGKDPQTSGCGVDATTMDSFTTDDGVFYVELRWSYTCWAAWTRIHANSPCTCAVSFGEIQGFDINTGRLRADYGIQALAGQSRYTKMVTFDYLVRACYSNRWFTGYPTVCTPKQ